MKATLTMSKAEAKTLAKVLDWLWACGENHSTLMLGLPAVGHRHLSTLSTKADRLVNFIENAEKDGLS